MDIISKTNKAISFAKTGKFGEAEFIYKELLKENPENTTLLSLYGYMCIQCAEFEKAEKLFESAYTYSQNLPIIKGLVYAKYYLRKMPEAIQYYVKLVELEPVCENYKGLTSLLADMIKMYKFENYIDKVHYIINAYNKFPLNTEIMKNYAVYNLYYGNFELAEKICRNILKIDKKYAEAWELLGFIYEGVYCDEEKAQKCHLKSVKYGLKGTGYYNLGISYSKSCQYRKATRAFNKAQQLSSDDKDIISLAKAENYLKQKKFKQGYELFVKYDEMKNAASLRNRWDKKVHKDKSILVVADMCFGDHIFFSRYLPFLSKYFKTVKVQVFEQLRELFEDNFKGLDFVSNIEFPETDYYVLLSHLPYYLNMDFNHIPSSKGYINSTSAKIDSDKLKIGLCWEAGNRDIRLTIHRNVNIKEFKPLFEKDYDVYSFQIDAVMDSKEYPMIDLSSKIHNFSDTARFLKSMDVLISVDTSVANLAGALGVKTFLMLPYYSDWRWFENDKSTEWYDSVTIYRQTEKHSWQNEINRIVNDLERLKK